MGQHTTAQPVHSPFAAPYPGQTPYGVQSQYGVHSQYGAQTQYSQPQNGVQQQWGGVGYPAAGYQSPYQHAPGRPGQPGRSHGNTYAFITLGVVAAYVVVALTIGVVFFGIIPVVMAGRSVRAREPLAPLAIVGAVVAIGMAILLLAGR
jgi:hypothetical protein